MHKIKEEIENRGIKKSWLAAKSGVHITSIMGYCSQRYQPSLESIFKIAKALKVKPSDLIDDEYKLPQW